jgi:hypothetical protein
MQRASWPDERIDEKMTAVDQTFKMLHGEMMGLRSEMRALRSDMGTEIRELRSEVSGEIRELRSDFYSLQSRLVQIGFGMVGVLLAALIALIVAVL